MQPKFQDTYFCCLRDPAMAFRTLVSGFPQRWVIRWWNNYTDFALQDGHARCEKFYFDFLASLRQPFFCFLESRWLWRFHRVWQSSLRFTALHGPLNDSKHWKQKKHVPSFAWCQCWQWCGDSSLQWPPWPVTSAALSLGTPCASLLVWDKKKTFNSFRAL